MMGTHVSRMVLVLALVLSAVAVVPGAFDAGLSASAQGGVASGLFDREAYQGRYIVVLNVDAGRRSGVIQTMRRDVEFTVDHEYGNVLVGFSARMGHQQAERLSRRSDVLAVYPDVEVHLEQQIPPGIAAIGVLENQTANVNGQDQRVDVDIAIIDTGIRASHADLNYAGGTTCVGGSPGSDGHGHGTHVAGTAAAIDNNIAVVGVSPGARLWAVKVLDDSGSGSLSSVICGVDWVAANAGTIDVANMSLGAELEVGSNDPMKEPIRRLVEDFGVPVVVSAGNNGVRADGYPKQVCTLQSFFGCRRSETRMFYAAPAAYPETIAVGAMNVSNNTRASFSNHGPAVDVYAPGVSILSTTSNSTTSTGSMSGTSMSSPHVAGAVGLYKAVNPGATPDQVRQALLDHGINHGHYDSFNQPLVHVAGFAPPGPNYDLSVGVTAPDNMFSDEQTDVVVSVENTGGETLTGIQVKLEVNGVEFGNQTVSSLNAGSNQNVTFSNWAPGSQGTFNLVATAQFDDGTNTASDSASRTVNVTDPVSELDVTSVDVAGTVYVNEATNVTVNVRNTGNQTLNNVSLTLEVQGQQIGSAQTVNSMSPNATASRTFSWTPGATGDQQLTGKASAGSVSGQLGKLVQVADRSQALTVTNVSASPSTIEQGQSTTIQVTVRNDSTQAETVSVALESTPNTGISSSTPASQSIPVGATRTFSFSWAASELAEADNYNVLARAQLTSDAAIQATGLTTVTVNERPSVVNMHVHSLTANYSTSRAGQSVSGQVVIRDANNQPVSGATVVISMTSTGTTTVTTNANGVASYSFSALWRRGTYTVAVQNVTRDGYQYEPANNVITSVNVNI